MRQICDILIIFDVITFYWTWSVLAESDKALEKKPDNRTGSKLIPWKPNYCNDTSLLESNGLNRTSSGQFLSYKCDSTFFHCRLTASGYKTYKKTCRVGLVFDGSGTQNCNYDFNVDGCSNKQCACTTEQFSCCLSGECVDMSARCNGKYDCALEEDEQNCASCAPDEFPCTLSEQCVSLSKRCDGYKHCTDGTDEQFCSECAAGMFWCRKSKQCIRQSERCNRQKDCNFGEDELFCIAFPQRNYLCEDQQHSVPIKNLCDGIADCPDNSDEAYCSNGANWSSHQHQKITEPSGHSDNNKESFVPVSEAAGKAQKNEEKSEKLPKLEEKNNELGEKGEKGPLEVPKIDLTPNQQPGQPSLAGQWGIQPQINFHSMELGQQPAQSQKPQVERSMLKVERAIVLPPVNQKQQISRQTPWWKNELFVTLPVHVPPKEQSTQSSNRKIIRRKRTTTMITPTVFATEIVYED